MTKITYIYGLIDPRTDEIRYIGKTKNLVSRYSAHCRERRSNIHKTNWISQLSREGLKPLLHILDVCDDFTWEEKEIFWINYGKQQGWRLTNCVDGGRGIHNPTEETRRKLSESHKGKNNRLGYKHTQETKDKIGKIHKGRKDTEESRHKKSVALRGKNSPLTEDDVFMIRKLIQDGAKQRDIAKEFNVSAYCINNIHTRKT